MSGGELAVVLASVAVVVAVAVLGAIGVSLNRALRDVRRLVSEVRRDLLPAVARIEEASGRVTGEVERVGGLLDVAEAVSERAESLSRATYRALVEPFAAVASLFRRGSASGPTAPVAPEPVATGWAPAVAAPRRASWGRRTAAYLLRSGYRAASARIAGRLATAQAQRSAATATRRPSRDPVKGPAAKGSDVAPGRRATPSGDPRWARQFSDAVRVVTAEISAALEEGRRTLRSDRLGEDRPE